MKLRSTLLLLVTLVGTVDAQRSLIASVGDAGAPQRELGRRELRQRTVRLDDEFAARLVPGPEELLPGERWTFEPFAGSSFVLAVDRVRIGSRGALTAWGVTSDGLGSFALARVDDAIHLTVHAGGAAFVLRRIEGEWYSVAEVVASDLPGCAGATGELGFPGGENESASLDPGAVHDFDVLMVYTPDALDVAGGHPEMVASIEVMLAQGNQALANSLADSSVAAQYDLLAAMYGDWNQDGLSMDWQLDKFRGSGDGYLDEVHKWRDVVGADLVGLLIDYTGTDFCGKGYLMEVDVLSGSAVDDKTFSVSDYSCSLGGFTLIHELGHNLGLAHNPEDVDVHGITNYSYGHRWQGTDGDYYRSIMSYRYEDNDPPSTQVPHYSNPGVDYAGKPTGLSSRDNARAIEEWGAFVEAVRKATKLGDVWVDFDAASTGWPGTGSTNFPYWTMQEGVLKVANGGTIHVRGPGVGVLPWLERSARIEVESGGPVSFVEGP